MIRLPTRLNSEMNTVRQKPSQMRARYCTTKSKLSAIPGHGKRNTYYRNYRNNYHEVIECAFPWSNGAVLRCHKNIAFRIAGAHLRMPLGRNGHAAPRGLGAASSYLKCSGSSGIYVHSVEHGFQCFRIWQFLARPATDPLPNKPRSCSVYIALARNCSNYLKSKNHLKSYSSKAFFSSARYFSVKRSNSPSSFD